METIHQLIRERYSSVIFSSKPVEDEKLELLFEAARWAPSSYNEQPWRFIVGVKNKNENYKKLYDCLVEANQHWAEFAPVLVLSVALKNSPVTGNPNRFAQYDTGMAVGNLLIQATFSGLVAHQMGGYNVSKLREFFNLNEEYELMAVMAIGYKGDATIFPEDLKERELKKRFRKPLDEILM